MASIMRGAARLHHDLGGHARGAARGRGVGYDAAMMNGATPAPPGGAAVFGALLRRWRCSRRLTQEQLAGDAEISTRHLSCLETGKAQPSREMVLLLASALELELRDRNVMLGAAGFAALYRASSLDAPEMQPVQRALELQLRQQEPFGAVVLDRAWNLLRWNQGAQRLLQRFLPAETPDPLVLSNLGHALFAPGGLRPFVVNWEEVAALTIERLHREIAMHPHDDDRRALREALLAYDQVPARLRSSSAHAVVLPFVPLHLRRGDDEVRMLTTLTTLGTALDITAAELTIESYFPADAASEALLRRWAQ